MIAFGFAAITPDLWIFSVCMGVGSLLVLWRIYLLDVSAFARIVLAVCAITLFLVVVIRTVYFPAPLTATANTERALAETTNEQEVRQLLTEQARAYRSLVALFNRPPAPVPEPPPVINENAERERLQSNLSLWEFYPKYEWPLSGDATAASRPIEGQTLRAAFNPNRGDYRLTPLLFNGNGKDGIPLNAPKIVIWFPIAVQARPSRLWGPNTDETTRSFFTWAEFGPILTAPTGVNESLFLTFPGPGKYPVKFRLEGIARNIALRKDGEFTLELVEPTP